MSIQVFVYVYIQKHTNIYAFMSLEFISRKELLGPYDNSMINIVK
jgi:hypothetical protein